MRGPPIWRFPLETVCFIIMKACQFDAKEAATESDPGSNPTDDNDVAVLQDHADDPVQEELISRASIFEPSRRRAGSFSQV